VTTIVDLELISADEFDHLAHLRREADRRAADRSIARALDILQKPTLGYYRNQAEAVQP
jgi:hypothetical protein